MLKLILEKIFSVYLTRKTEKDKLKLEFWKEVCPELLDIEIKLKNKSIDISKNKYNSIKKYYIDNGLFGNFFDTFRVYGTLFIGGNFSQPEDDEINIKNMFRISIWIIKYFKIVKNFIKIIEDLREINLEYNIYIKNINIRDKKNNEECAKYLYNMANCVSDLSNLLNKSLMKQYLI